MEKTNKYNVLFMLGSLNRGGAETLLSDIFNFQDTPFVPHLVYRKSSEMDQYFLNSGRMVLKLPFKLNNIFKFNKVLIDNNISLIHAQQPLDALFALFFKFNYNIPVVMSVHCYDFGQPFIWKIFLRIAIKLTKMNIFVSENQRSYFVDKYKIKINKHAVVYNGISYDKLKNSSFSPKNNIRNELNIDKNTKLFVSVGNFVLGRDQMTLCKFIHILKAKYNNFHFIFVGKRIEQDNELFDNCITYCEKYDLLNHVSFIGVREDVYDILKQSDAFIYATNHDTFGLAVVEAMSCGIPVFTNDWNVMKEISENGDLVTLYRSHDINDLLELVLQFINDVTPFLKKSINAKNYVLNEFTIEKHIKNLDVIYKRLLNL